MIIALPLTANDAFSTHFGGSSKVGMFEVDPDRRTIVRASAEIPPVPEPCGWATWLAERGVTVFLAGGMGGGACQRMAAAGIDVVVGISPAAPVTLVQAWLDGALTPGANACEGEHGAQEPGDGGNCCGAGHSA